MTREFLVDHAQEGADLERVVEIFLMRPGAIPTDWRVIDGSTLFVVRALPSNEVAAFALVRVDIDRAEVCVDVLECERRDGHATMRGIRAMEAFGSWLEGWVARRGGAKVLAVVGVQNQVHIRALTKKGYNEAVVVLEKVVPAQVEEAV